MTARQARRMLSIAKALDQQVKRANELDIATSTGERLDARLADLATDLRHLVMRAIVVQASR